MTRACDESVRCTALRVRPDGSVAQVENVLQEESRVDVFVNGVAAMQIACSANHPRELAVGRLYTEGVIRTVKEVDRVSIRPGSARVDVSLKASAIDFARNGADRPRRAPPEALPPLAWSPAQVFALAAEFETDKTSHARTRGVHSAYLAPREGNGTRLNLLCMREDIGRHNAFDKVVGWALLNGVDLRGCMLFTSGRVPTDMVMKAIRSKIPVLVSKAVATDETVALARRYGLTLLCTATSHSFDVMNDPCGTFAEEGSEGARRETGVKNLRSA